MRRLAVLVVPTVAALSLMVPATAVAAPTLDLSAKCTPDAGGPGWHGVELVGTVTGLAPNQDVTVRQDSTWGTAWNFSTADASGTVTVGGSTFFTSLTTGTIAVSLREGHGTSNTAPILAQQTVTWNCALPDDKSDCKKGGFANFGLESKKECKDIVKGKT